MKFITEFFRKKYKLTKRDDGVYEAFERNWWESEYRLIGESTDFFAAFDLFMPLDKNDGR